MAILEKAIFPAKELHKVSEDGLKTIDGYWVYHTSRSFYRTNIPKEISINLSTEFSNEEDGQLKKNWKRFKKKNKLDDDADIFFYIGIKHPDSTKILEMKEAKKLNEINMWPALCRKLDDRTARMVQKRLSLIFDPYYNGENELNLEQLWKLKKLLYKKTSLEKIYLKMKIPYRFITDVNDVKTKTKISVFENVLIKNKIQESKVIESISEYSLEGIEKLTEGISKWNKIWKKIKDEDAKWIWYISMIELCMEWNHQSKNENEKEKWEDCKRKVFKLHTSCYERFYLNCLFKCVLKQKIIFEKDSFDMEKLNEQLKRSEYSHDEEESRIEQNNKLFLHVKTRISYLEKKFFQYLEPKPNLKEKLMILVEVISRILPRKHKINVLFRVSLQTAFDVIHEYYSIRYQWTPPEQLSHYKINDTVLSKLREIKKSRDRKKEFRLKRKADTSIDERNKKKKMAIRSGSVTDDMSSLCSSLEETVIEARNRTEKTVRFGDVTHFEIDENNMENTNEFRLDETVLAGHGMGEIDQDTLGGSIMFESEDRNRNESLILNIPDVVISKKEKEIVKIEEPKDNVDNWLDLLG